MHGHYAVQGHSGSPILVPIESSYASVINTNLRPVLHRFQVMYHIFASDRGECFTLTPSLGMIPCKYSDKLYIYLPKLE